jgi:hypothetical protein
MTKIIKIVWGLLFDDVRLAVFLLLALTIAAILCNLGYNSLGMIVMWLGMLLALFISIEHQLQNKLKSKAKQ